MSIFNSAPKPGTTSPSFSPPSFIKSLFFYYSIPVWFELFFILSEQSDTDDGAAKPNPSLTREKDLVVNISDLDNIFDEDDEELGVRYNIFHPLNMSGFVSLSYLSFVDCLHESSVH